MEKKNTRESRSSSKQASSDKPRIQTAEGWKRSQLKKKKST